MDKGYTLVGGDRRIYWAAQYLRERGYPVRSWGVEGMEDSADTTLRGNIILPLPAFCGERISGAGEIPVGQFLRRLESGSRIFGGLLRPWQEALEGKGVFCCELYGSEPLTTANAVPTAEGAIALAMDHSIITLQGSQCLVIGYGRIGKVLAQKLQALGAEVTVCARKPGDCALAEAQGCRSDETGVYYRGLELYDYLFNTVPGAVLTEEQLRRLPKNCLLIELASAPGGFDGQDCEALGLRYVLARGLPGKCAPKTAGEIYARSILDYWEGKDVL